MIEVGKLYLIREGIPISVEENGQRPSYSNSRISYYTIARIKSITFNRNAEFDDAYGYITSAKHDVVIEFTLPYVEAKRQDVYSTTINLTSYSYERIISTYFLFEVTEEYVNEYQKLIVNDYTSLSEYVEALRDLARQHLLKIKDHKLYEQEINKTFK